MTGLPLIADIETIVHPEAAAFLPPPDLTNLTPPGNYTKPDTIAKWREDEKVKRQNQWAEDLNRCSLDPDLCRIVAIGFMQAKDEDATVLLAKNEEAEAEALRQFWATLDHSMLIGYNFAGFDAPTLLRRSLLLGVKAPGLFIAKYKHPGVVDIMKLLGFDGLLPWRKQSFYLKRFRLSVPEDCHTGADIARLVEEDNWDAVRHHVRCDVLGARALAAHIGLVPKVA